MIRHSKGQARDDYIRESLAQYVHAHPKTVRPEKDTARGSLELLEQPAAWSARTLHQQIHLRARKETCHAGCYLLHPAVARKQNERASVRFFEKVRDPLG